MVLKYMLVVSAALLFTGRPGDARIFQKGSNDVVVRQFEDCTNSGTNEFQLVGNKVRKFNRTSYIYTGQLIIPREVNNDFKLKPVVAYYGNGGWKSTPTGLDLGGLCHMLINFVPKLLKQVMGTFNGVPPPYCPIPPGNYTIKELNMLIDADLYFIPPNRYRLDFLLSRKDGTVVGCKRVFVDSISKRPRVASG